MRRYKDEAIKIKRYGQVFSGKQVGNLLVSMLPKNTAVRSIIDPMVGQGDLLQAAYLEYPNAKLILGIDIDEDVKDKCTSAVPEAEIHIEDAFKSEKIDIKDGWDLVITNPPYIRYQTLKSNPEIGLPDGKELRDSLLKHIQQSMLLDDKEKQLYLETTKRYSGLSDMAVPSWILCASIVKKGGYMAMVVPETWLSRDYALPIHYLLLRCFEIVAVARDIESAWFENAEIRTCLVVCKRKGNEPIENSYSETVYLELGSKLMDSESLVGNMRYNNYYGHEAINRIIYSKDTYSFEGFSSRIVSAIELFPGFVAKINEQNWVYKEDKLVVEDIALLPNEIREIVCKNSGVEYDSLGDMGWSIGQGLRTGANDFFYAQLISENTMSVVKTEPWYGKEIVVSSNNITKALKKRADVNGLVVSYEDLDKCILYIQNQVRREDYPKISNKMVGYYSIMDPDLDDYITQGERYVSPAHKRAFKELSAVITNEKKTGDGYERFWYMLPLLKERHVPDLCISRVCGESPETLFVNQQHGNGIIVDANFITLWNPNHNDHILGFVLLNSTWAKLFMEVTGTVMGGGALKLEASHIRKMVFPKIKDEKKLELERIGKRILENNGISKKHQKQIDDIVATSFGEKNKETVRVQLEMLLTRKIQERTGRKNNE